MFAKWKSLIHKRSSTASTGRYLMPPRFDIRLANASDAVVIGWHAHPVALPDKIVAGAGVQLRRTLPHPVGEPGGEIAIAEGRHAMVINVFTEPDWRRRGLATFLMERLIAWARAERLDRLVLHASDEGRRVYERLGFIENNEMRFRDRLDVPQGKVVR